MQHHLKYSCLWHRFNPRIKFNEQPELVYTVVTGQLSSRQRLNTPFLTTRLHALVLQALPYLMHILQPHTTLNIPLLNHYPTLQSKLNSSRHTALHTNSKRLLQKTHRYIYPLSLLCFISASNRCLFPMVPFATMFLFGLTSNLLQTRHGFA